MKKLFLIIPLVLFFVPAVVRAQVTYQKDIRPLLDSKCSICHGSTSPLVDDFKKEKEKYTKENKGPRMDSYPLLLEFVKGKDAGAIMRRLMMERIPKMENPEYVYLPRQDKEEREKNLKTFKSWIDHGV
jgi:hypothetical protein